MQKVAAFVDAGYFWVQCSQILFNDIHSRKDIVLNIGKMREELLKLIFDEFKIDEAGFLRIYWYDGISKNGIPSKINEQINFLENFKVRYGTINSNNQQKGVDGLIIADLINLAQNKAITSALLISGDADLAPGVSAAQTLGIKVYRVEIHNSEASSHILRAEVDKNILWKTNVVKKFIKTNDNNDNAEEIITSFLDDTEEKIESQEQFNYDLSQIAIKFLQQISDSEKPNDMIFEKGFDIKLLNFGKSELGRFLESKEIYQLRHLVRRELGLTE